MVVTTKIKVDTESQVQLQNISKRYNVYEKPVDRLKELLWRGKKCLHKEFWALNDFTYSFKKHTTAVLGANGSGKSTLLQIIAGVLKPTTGIKSCRGRITAILELGAGFKSEFTGRENAILYGMILGIPKDEMEERLMEINEFAELGDFFDQPIKTYSSGMVVRLAFACATVVDPEILIVDEALAVGDEHFQKKCFYRILDLQEQAKTIILVSHNTAAVKEYCQSAILLNAGQIIADGCVDTVVEQYKEVVSSADAQQNKHFTE